MQNSTQNAWSPRFLKLLGRQPIQMSRFFAKILANIVNVLQVSKTAQTLQLNLEISLPHLSPFQRTAVTKQAIQNEITSYFEFVSIWGSDNQTNLARIHNIHGEHLFHAALAENKGVVIIIPHFGTWEILNTWLSQYTQMTIMYKPIKNVAVNQFVRSARSREKAILVPTDESGVRQIFKALKQGGTTVILPDHSPKHWTDFVPYFGIPLASSNLSAKLIQKTKARSLFIYALRNQQDGFDIHIDSFDEALYQGTANEGTAVIHQKIEQLIHQYPEHYHWSYKRFKAHPDLRNIYNVPVTEALQRINQLRDDAAKSSVDESY